MTDSLGLGEAYGATLDRVKGQGGEKARLGMAALMWISHSERPLKASELCHALGVEIGSPDINADNIPSIVTLLACCQGLVTVDKEASTVRLIHYTLQEYLQCHPEIFGKAHSTIAETCLSYLNSRKIKALSTSPFPNPQDTPFLEYSSLYWGVHAKRELSDCAKFLALKLFNDQSNHISSKILLEAQKQHFGTVDFDKISLFSGLHCASFFGIINIVTSLVGAGGCDINKKDCVGNTPLIWAARNGHERVVEVLLGQGDIDPNRPSGNGGTPLWWAAYVGHEAAVFSLLRRDDVNPDEPIDSGETPLSCAAVNGHQGVVKMLLGRDGVNPNRPQCRGKTPLLRAAWNGHEGVVKILLERDDIDPNRPQFSGETPLLWAASRGHEAVVEILLGRDDVDPNEPEPGVNTPLWWAASEGHEGVVKTLLRRDDVDPHKPNKSGVTPLQKAAKNGHTGVVALLQPLASAAPRTT